jgi:dsRNA-specific ribonuclease
MRVSDKCILITRTDEAVHNLEQFQANVDYTSLLQEFVQQFGVDFPKYNYVQVSKKIHLPTFRCQASFQGFVAEATGNSKKRARQKAAHDLLKQLTRTVGPSENKPKG